MAERVAPGAFDKVAEHLTRVVKRPDGGDITAFENDRRAKEGMRKAVNEHEVDIIKIKEDLAKLPFPFAVRS